MRQTNYKPRRRDTWMLSGWLFADLLLALAVLFLAANTVGVKPKPIPTPTPLPTATPTHMPSPTPEPRLDFNYKRLQLQNVDYQGLLNDSPSAIDDVKQQVKDQFARQQIQNRVAGLAIIYGGAPTDNDIQQAFSISKKVRAVLESLGSSGFAFQRSSYYDPLYKLGDPPTNVEIDVYLFQ